ncbi:DUF1684 domain-containing protein [Streptomyces sp. NBC_01190]|uniref:DUF1684 domain-containing protein n=1 Tax=Streptomyces sp. NBC_01190 TaxID=2903767 RepID=UPI003865D506|nr:DUF1684 domain-containing protein [Streptomyces sp. NBC_01190]
MPSSSDASARIADPVDPADAARDSWDAWRAARAASVTAPTGNLALVETRWLPKGTPAEPEAERHGLPPTVRVTSLERADILTGEPEFGLRFWDSESPAIQHFSHIETYAFDPRWVTRATFTPVADDRRIPFEHIRDNGGSRGMIVPGDISLSLDGVDYTLAAFDDDGTLLLVFGDPTNGVSTYGSGRFLYVPRDQSGQERETVVLDFNRAFVPPCGFSAEYNCPLPPPQNRLHLPVEAGEKRPVFSGGPLSGVTK